MGERVHVETRAPVATIAFDHPERQNALTPAMLAELASGLAAISAREDVRVVVVRGAGDLPFSSGYDLGEVPDRPLTLSDARAVHAPIRAAADAILTCRHPVVAAVRGLAFGAALELVAHCDLRIASAEARFSMPPVRLGFLYAYEGMRRFVEIVGLTHATELFLLGETIPAPRAREIGLVHRVLEPSSFEAGLGALAGALAENAPLAVRATKAALGRARWDGDPSAAFLDGFYERIAVCLNSADVREARRAFAEKRRPVFLGR